MNPTSSSLVARLVGEVGVSSPVGSGVCSGGCVWHPASSSTSPFLPIVWVQTNARLRPVGLAPCARIRRLSRCSFVS